jgi:hypothetical protein
MYHLPLESPVSTKVAPSRPGGLAGQAHTRSPPLPPRRSFKGRQSEESIYARSARTTNVGGEERPPTLRRDSSGVMSVHSARSANVFEDGPSKAVSVLSIADDISLGGGILEGAKEQVMCCSCRRRKGYSSSIL